ncbi:hypothetical protein FVR03_16430 [Pontibacter qinzhouensis]|uniref:DUF2007 domain-containing protein n=1 Tax=Pontibacter qinzhouensis TaxID=2603253 RepID=A0A5C8JJ68_9BACT|nr:hypothetical protein [Pontibacter qinzhouensis]TXK36963.1 hypothetical protein FVR03_16430 [Pontibacter qinzhouensis]
MADEAFSVFKKFPEMQQAKELAHFLQQHGLAVLVADNSPVVDLTFTGNHLQSQFEVKIPASDFSRAQKMLEERVAKDLDSVDESHYLFSFSDEELYDVLLKSDEWTEFDFLLAKKILKSRGQEVNDALIASLKKQRLLDLSTPEEGQQAWIFLGYLLSLLGGFLGMCIGWFLWKQKKTLPNGQKVYAYTAPDRKHGRNMFFIGVIVFSIVFAVKLLNAL